MVGAVFVALVRSFGRRFFEVFCMSPWPRATDAPSDFRWKAGTSASPAAEGLRTGRFVSWRHVSRAETRVFGARGYGFSTPAKAWAAKVPQCSRWNAGFGLTTADFVAFPRLFQGSTAFAVPPKAANGLAASHQSGEQVTNLVNHRFGERLTGSVSPNLVRSRVASQISSFAFSAIFQLFSPHSVRASRSAPAGSSLERNSR